MYFVCSNVAARASNTRGAGAFVALAPLTTAVIALAMISGRKSPGAQSNTTPLTRSNNVIFSRNIIVPPKINPPFDATCSITSRFSATSRVARATAPAYASATLGTNVAALGGAITSASHDASTYISAYFRTYRTSAPNHPMHTASGRVRCPVPMRSMSSTYGAKTVVFVVADDADDARRVSPRARDTDTACGRATPRNARSIARRRVRLVLVRELRCFTCDSR
mmetsp:Transcript_6933/g.25279  ORF Transcript_6933/g.25279 Transcript_6933/m.25279 type:complete len:224 (+) Transcript_6933:3221-3892(+)